MLNQSVKINMNTPATGIIQRSSEKSFFIRCHQTSRTADNLFSSSPWYEGKSVYILQVILINEGYVLIEAVFDESGA
jgi:hypothetical protein